MNRTVPVLLSLGVAAMVGCGPTPPVLRLPARYDGSVSGTHRTERVAACPGLRSVLEASADVRAEVQAVDAVVGEVAGSVSVSYCRPAVVAPGAQAQGIMSFTCCGPTGGLVSAFSGPATVTFGAAGSLSLDMTITGGQGVYLGAVGACHVEIRVASVEPPPVTPLAASGSIGCRIGDQAHPPPASDVGGSIRTLTGGHRQQRGSMNASVSDDGGVVSFSSDAADLGPVAGDGLVQDVFTWDRASGAVRRITSGNGDSNLGTRMSGDGSTVVFSSDATDLVAGDANGAVDVFLAGAAGGPVTAVTLGNDWSSGAVVSRDGRTVVFSSRASDLVAGDANGHADLFVWDRSTARTARLVSGNGPSWGADLSNDGNRVTFLSEASDLVAGDGNGRADLFVLDRATRVVTRIADAGGRFWGAGISGDGWTVAFASATTEHVAAGAADTNGGMDVFRHDLRTAVTRRLTNDNAPSNSDPTLSDDGRVVAFNSMATDIAPGEEDVDGNDDLFVWNASTSRVSRLTRSGAPSGADTMYPEVSGDGRSVAFSSRAADLDPAVPSDGTMPPWNTLVWERTG